MQIQKAIEQLGYTANEAKVYLATLSLGEANVSAIAARARVPRTSAQAIMGKLLENGLTNYYVQKRYKFWVAENPERLLSAWQQRVATIEAALPTLKEMRKSYWTRKPPRITRAHNLGFFKVLADAMPQPLLITNADFEIEYVNAPWEQVLGYSLYEVRGQKPSILRTDDTPEKVHEDMWRALSAGKIFQSDQIVDRRKNGSTVRLLTTIFSVTRNGATYFVQILDDVNNQHAAQYPLYASALRESAHSTGYGEL